MSQKFKDWHGWTQVEIKTWYSRTSICYESFGSDQNYAIPCTGSLDKLENPWFQHYNTLLLFGLRNKFVRRSQTSSCRSEWVNLYLLPSCLWARDAVPYIFNNNNPFRRSVGLFSCWRQQTAAAVCCSIVFEQ